ncbi:hypothetical protein H1R82_05530 [Thermoactinomyces intermedius]|jgi:hypothetical protein|uniref:Uncharacterized protein n=1 Tax=Thermoactinomyces intermedius TaxID=2024 RepID=A0A8I1ABV2_THEIN|nr:MULTISPECIES: hypothetical protein [Thermoactinomyces]MBA4547475.1 hypothetical protein [Thermoactinomyces intermedius]MBA4836099.1 hypothetical protein [Thermoactinomyces intermedius]MBH8594295.1 hypothetical protein [Thermoactinomyces intermedius]MBH8601131.1 hypothetical protein [Thermoactinomyces sp. CICC 23799]
MEVIAPVFFQIFSIMAIILPVSGGIFALFLLYRGVKALEGIREALEKSAGDQKTKKEEPRDELN